MSLLARNLVRGSGRLCREAQLRHGAADGGDQPLEILRLERAHAADAEALRLRQLARIDDEATRRERGVEIIEAEARILRRPEGRDDRRLDALVEKEAKPETRHAVRQCPEIRPVMRIAGSRASFA